MTQRDNTSQVSHDTLIWAMVNELERRGNYVKADHIGHRNGQPELVNGHIPDIEASSNGTRRIIEAETPETFNSPDTKKQFMTFYNAYGSRFEVIVPRGYREEIRKIAYSWGVIPGEIWEA